MNTSEISINITQAGRDDRGAVYVEGDAPAGLAVGLVPRRYRKQPDWWVIEIVGIDAPGSDAMRFRLSCSAEGLWGTEGIEIECPASSVRITREETRWGLRSLPSEPRREPKDG